MTKQNRAKALTSLQMAERASKANEFWKLLIKEGVVDYMTTLYFRWQDEKDYEPFSEYREAFERSCRLTKKLTARLVSFTARPLNAVFNLGVVGGDDLEVKVTITSKTAQMIYGRGL
jgi:hypothetical protein